MLAVELFLELLDDELPVEALLLSVVVLVELLEELSVVMLLLSVSVGYSCSDMSGSICA